MKPGSSDVLKALRTQLQASKVDAFIIPTDDAHLSEYVSEADKRRDFVSGFTGSAGKAVVTQKAALLWTDGRYFLQAEQELTKEWTLMKMGEPGVPDIKDWLLENLDAGASVGIDPYVTGAAGFKAWSKIFDEEKKDKGLKLVPVAENPVDKVWKTRPPIPCQPLLVLPESYAGQSTAAKVDRIRERLEEEGAHAYVLSALDEVAWLFNLRGADIEYNPVFMAYAVVARDHVSLYIDSKKVTPEIQKHLGSTTVKGYTDVFSDLAALSKQLPSIKPTTKEEREKLAASVGTESKEGKAKPRKIADICNKIWLDTDKSNVALLNSIDEKFLLEKESPISMMKAVKNPVELEGMRQAHIRDGAAVCQYFDWLERVLEGKIKHDVPLDEVSVADKLEAFRKEQKDFVGLSFPTISGSGPNGAVIHYHPHKESCRAVNVKELYLCDSGAQYKDGTTDITRTAHFGTPDEFEREAFTRVLQGHIGLARAVFPDGTSGGKLDVLAREALWKLGLDYKHGTGHGVGHFLNVHEGPHGISFRAGSVQTVALVPGMVVTNEPGYYHDGKFGIRIESVMVVEKAKTAHKFGGREFLGFETITMCPIQAKMIRKDLMTEGDLEWLNEYHRTVYQKVSPLLSGTALDWLKRNTAHITK